MPFIGLLDNNDKEIKGKGYHRIDASGIIFKISPSNDPGVHWVFINISEIRWIAGSDWPDIYHVCVYDEVDDKAPISMAPLNISDIRKGDSVVTLPGQFCLTMTINPPKKGPPDKPERCPKCGTRLTVRAR